MLTISKPLSAGQAQSYHKKEFTSQEQSYWSQGNAVQGEWQGRLATEYGLAGAVGEEEFARLSRGQHPHSGEELVRHRLAHEYKDANGKSVTSMEHRAGWDATFSAAKSVSLTALVGGDYRIREAHRESVRAALDELERYTLARIGGNHPAENTGKFIVAKFEHDTARPVNGYAAPQLHTHAVIFNVTERENGETRALQERGLFQSQQFATAIYQSELMYRLRQLGYEIERGRSGAPEIKGYTQEYLDASSPRSQQIREHLEKIGHNSKEAAEIAAHSTRDHKEILSPREVLDAHRRLAAEFGSQPDAVVQAARERARYMQASIKPPHSAQEAVTFARDKNFEREAVVDDRLLMRDALRRGMGELRYPEVRANFETRHKSGEFVSVERGPYATGPLFTTAKTIAAEQEVVNRMHEGQYGLEQLLSRRSAIAVTEAHPHLNLGQKTVVEDVLSCRDRIQGIQGVAGAGKTTALAVIRSAVETQGYQVEGFAPTSRAAKQLQEAGVSSATLQSFLAKSAYTSPDQRRFYFVDESSLASTNQIRDFLQRLGPEDRVLFVGDTRQHQGVEAGRPFQQLQEAGMKTAKLEQIVRQKDPVLRSEVEMLAKGRTGEALDSLKMRGKITEIIEPGERIRAIARNYVRNPERALVVSPDNKSRQEVNEAIRQELKANGSLGTDDYKFRVLVARQDMTGAERAWARRYELEDIVRFSRGSKSLGIEPGSYAKVVGVNAPGNLLTIQTGEGNQFTYDPKRLSGVTVYESVERQFATGDRIQFTAPNKQLRVANRELGIVDRIAPDASISVILEDGKNVELNATAHPHFDLGYAVTSHSAQGLTADRVLINVDTGINPELLGSRFAYVAVSRARFDAEIFTNDSAELGKSLSTEIGKTSAIDCSQSAGISAERHFGMASSL